MNILSVCLFLLTFLFFVFKMIKYYYFTDFTNNIFPFCLFIPVKFFYLKLPTSILQILFKLNPEFKSLMSPLFSFSRILIFLTILSHSTSLIIFFIIDFTFYINFHWKFWLFFFYLKFLHHQF